MHTKSIKTNFHTHTTFCDGKNTPEEMVQVAIERGFSMLGFSSHSLYPFSLKGNLNHTEHESYANEILRLKKQYADRLEIFLGFEADYIPGICCPRFENYAAFKPDFLIGSVHFIPNSWQIFGVDNTPDDLASGINNVFGGDVQKAVSRYFSLQREMLERGDFTIIGHPDLIRKFNGKMHLFSETEEWYKKEIQATAQAIAKAGVIAEINTGAISRGHMNEPYPSDYFLSILHELQVPITISSDAHFADGIDCAFEIAVERAKKAGYTEKAVLSSNGIQFTAL